LDIEYAVQFSNMDNRKCTKMKHIDKFFLLLLTVTAAIEALTGISLIVAPSLVVSLLIGTSPDGATTMTLARLAGVALMSLAIACWLSRNNAAAAGVVKAMLFYNVAAAAVLLYGAIGYKLSGVGLWPAVLLHAGLAVWCFVSLGQHIKTNKSI
jgi:hypothetical protein